MMKKSLIVLFCVLFLTIGLFAGPKNISLCEKFDYDIKQAFSHYGPIGVKVDLLYAKGKAIPVVPGTCIEVMLEVAPVVQNPKPVADTWHFCGGLIYKTTGPVPLGIRIINKDKLIGCCKAASKLPKSFPVNKSTINLYWALYPGMTEPYYFFTYGDQHHAVGAYTGKVYL